MKVTRTYSLVLLSTLFLLCPVASYAQGAPKNGGGNGMGSKSHVMLAGGYSLLGLFGGMVEGLLDGVDELTVKSSPEFIVNYDYKVVDKFSVGAGYTYQQLKMEYLDTVINLAGDTSYAFFKDKITRQNTGIRLAVHFNDLDEPLDTYAGVRVSMTFWGYKTDNPRSDRNPEAEIDEFFNEGKVRTQVFLGTRYYFNDFIGVGGEVAIGNPYFLALGIDFKF